MSGVAGPPPAPRWRPWLAWLVLAALLAAGAHAIDWRPALAAAARADPLWLAAAVAVNAAILIASTLQWWVLVPLGAPLPLRKVFELVALSNSVANAGPMLAGQAAAVHLFAGRGRLGHARALSMTVLEQLAEGMAKLALLAAAASVLPTIRGSAVAAAGLLAVPALAVGLAAATRRSDAVERWAARATGAIAAPARFLAEAVDSLDALRRPRRFAAAAVLGMLKKAIEGLAIAAAAAALGVALPPWAVLASLAAVNLSQLVALTPGNLGPYEAGAFLVYRAAGVAPEAALALAVVQHAAYLLPLTATGWCLEGARLALRGSDADRVDGASPS